MAEITPEEAKQELMNRAQAELDRRHPIKSFMSKTARPVLETGGQIAGELGGGAVGTMVEPGGGTLAGEVAGGGLGMATGGAAADELDTLLGRRQQPSADEMAKSFFKNTAKGAAYSVGGKLMGAAVASDPAQAVLRPVGRGLAKAAEITTGVPAKTFMDVAANPRMILPEWMGGEKPLAKAAAEYAGTKSAIVGASKEQFSKTLDELGMSKNLEPEGIYEETGSKVKQKINEIDKALKNGDKIQPEEALATHEYANSRLKPLKNKIDAKTASMAERDEFFGLLKLKKNVRGVIDEAYPEMSAAIDQYAKSSVKDAATKGAPQGYGGRYIARRMVPLAAGLMSPASAAAIFAGTSPMLMSGATAAASSGMLNAPLVRAIDMLRQRAKDQKKKEQSDGGD